MASRLITIDNCSVQDRYKKLLGRVDWQMCEGEAWLVTGPNGGGKAAFIRALSGQAQFVPNVAPAPAVPMFSSIYTPSEGKGGTAVVSLEVAAALIEEERLRDESEYMDRLDIGRTGRRFICEVLGGPLDKNSPLPAIAEKLDALPEVKLCGVGPILDRGLKLMSTGEIRRTLLCRALLSGCSLLIFSDPFAGLDVASRKILLEFFDTILKRQLSAGDGESSFPRIILSMERFHEIPSQVNRVLEFRDGAVSFCGGRTDYEAVIADRKAKKEASRDADKKAFLEEIERIRTESGALVDEIKQSPVPDSLIKFSNVNVGWDEHRVLVNLNWEVRKGEHWLIRGPNGSGKTTILELITGDNMQVFREDVSLFGRRRGTGETIWDIKRQLGIVSYRLHVEYRMVGGTDLESVIVSGFHDSIGLYELATDFE
ncbi:MAG: ATP-binding cassette domain-containing protein, partial [Treponema sp.]|nr:ATP-binding cassette domain-containing protein [Treponema sp.]